MIKRIIIAATFALPIALLFQNCSGVSFESMDNARLVAKGENIALGEEGPNLPFQEEIPSPVVQEPTDKKGPKNLEQVQVVDTEEPESGLLLYTCVLEGPGSSVRLHLEQNLLSDHSTINEVCTSERACLQLVSQKFNVKFAKPSGFCGKNKHTVTLSDLQIMDLIK